LRVELHNNNKWIQASVSFSKNPIKQYDYTVLKFTLIPFIKFPFRIKKIILHFSNTLLDFTEDVSLDTECSKTLPLYIDNKAPSTIVLKTISIQLNSENELWLDVAPYKEMVTLLEEMQGLKEEVRLDIIPNEGVIDVVIKYKEPAFVNECFDIKLELKPIPDYEISDVEITFTESLYNDTWSLYTLSKDLIKDKVLKIGSIKKSIEVVELIIKFNTERKRHLEAHIKYKAKKVMADSTLKQEFSVTNIYNMNINAIFPVDVFFDFFTSNPFSLINYDVSYTNHLVLNKKTTIEMKVVSKSNESINVHSIEFFAQDEELVKLINNVPNWNIWPMLITPADVFSTTLSLIPLTEFINKELGTVKLIWSRHNNTKEEKVIYTFPIKEATCISQHVDMEIKLPQRTTIFNTFIMGIRLKNTSKDVLLISIEMKESRDFLIEGELKGSIILPSFYEDELSYILLPLKSGEIKLPKKLIRVSVNGKELYQVLDKDTSILVYP